MKLMMLYYFPYNYNLFLFNVIYILQWIKILFIVIHVTACWPWKTSYLIYKNNLSQNIHQFEFILNNYPNTVSNGKFT